MAKVYTIDGEATVLETQSNRDGTWYRVAGRGGAFQGWYGPNQIVSVLDEDETTTNIPFDDSEEPDEEAATIIPHDDPHAHDGVELPYNPDPTEEWDLGVDDGGLTMQPDGADISLTPSKSTKGADWDEDPESTTRVFGSIDWNDHETGTTHHGYPVHVEYEPSQMHFAIMDHDGNAIDEGASNYMNRTGGGRYFEPSDRDIDRIQRLAEEASESIGGSHFKHAGLKARPAFRQYIAAIHKDPFLREAAWKQVQQKGVRLFKDGSVVVQFRSPREIFATVEGDNGNYDTQIHRKNAFGQGITWWDCTCEWGKHAYLRQRTFVGRLCSHAYATYIAMQKKQESAPVQDLGNGLSRHRITASVDTPEYVRGESRAQREAGLMIWDDKLDKVIDKFFPDQQMGQMGQTPQIPNMGSPGSPLSSDTDNSLSADPYANDPSAANTGDPTGAGVMPSAATPEFVRQTTSPTAQDPTGNQVISANYWRSAEFDKNPSIDDDFEEWGEPNAEDADTFNDTDFEDDNDPEYAVYEEPEGKFSAISPGGFDPSKVVTPQSGAYSPAADAEDGYEPVEIGGQGDNGYSTAPGTTTASIYDLVADNYDYEDADEGAEGLDKIAGFFEDVEPDLEDPRVREAAYRNAKEAERFNSQEAAALQNRFARTAGRAFSFAEQDELINEDGQAEQLDSLNLDNSIYA